MAEPLDVDRLPHPSAREVWFHALPRERQREFTRRYRDDLKHTASLVRKEQGRWKREVQQTSLVFGLYDLLLLSHATAATVAAAFVVGLLLGALFVWTDAKRLLAGTLGLATLIVFVFVSRGGLAAQHLMVMFPMGGICAWLGFRRETRFFD